MPRGADDWLEGVRPRRGDGENPWRAYALDLQDRLRAAKVRAGEATARAAAAEKLARRAERSVVSLRQRGDDFHRLLQLEESAVRHERRALAEVERLLAGGDVPGALKLLAARRQNLAKREARS